MIDHKDIIPLVPIEMSGLSSETDLGLLEKEKCYEIIKSYINAPKPLGYLLNLIPFVVSSSSHA